MEGIPEFSPEDVLYDMHAVLRFTDSLPIIQKIVRCGCFFPFKIIQAFVKSNWYNVHKLLPAVIISKMFA
jgi:hypothetical protein